MGSSRVRRSGRAYLYGSLMYTGFRRKSTRHRVGVVRGDVGNCDRFARIVRRHLTGRTSTVEYHALWLQVTGSVNSASQPLIPWLAIDRAEKSRRTRRRKRGLRKGSCRSRVRQTRSIQAGPASVSTPRPRQDGYPHRYMVRTQRYLKHVERILDSWYELKKSRFSSAPGRDFNRWLSRKKARLAGFTDLISLSLDRVAWVRRRLEPLLGGSTTREWVEKKNDEWFRFVQEDERLGPPVLVSTERRLYRPPDGIGPVSSLDCPACGRRRISLASKCGCGYQRAMVPPQSRTRAVVERSQVSRGLRASRGRPGGRNQKS